MKNTELSINARYILSKPDEKKYEAFCFVLLQIMGAEIEDKEAIHSLEPINAKYILANQCDINKIARETGINLQSFMSSGRKELAQIIDNLTKKEN